MSAELRDFRGKITLESDLALDAMSRAFKRDKADIVREVLHNWALRKIMESRLLARELQSEGLKPLVDADPGE